MKPKILTENSRVEGAMFIQFHEFKNGHKVPLYDIFSMGALNQIIGHVKFANAKYGNVYYRGVNGLYNNVLPTLMRNRQNGIPNDLINTLNSICEHPNFKESLKLNETIYPKCNSDYTLNKKIKRHNRYRVEALLQHYAGSTRFLDVVDNHWVALWMGLHLFKAHGKGNKFYDSIKRELTIWDTYERYANKQNPHNDFEIYTYILLIAMPDSHSFSESGIYENDTFVEVDLRKALPSIYLRPHAQHALVIRKRDKDNIDKRSDFYDMASQVTAILRIRIDRVSEWLGNGSLLTKENLFPSPSIDQGYNNLLTYLNELEAPFDIKKYF